MKQFVLKTFCALLFMSFQTNAQLSISFTNVISVNCNGNCNGQATVVESGGTSPYTYIWSISGATTQTATGLCSGVYTVTVTDINSLTASSVVTITSPPPLTISPFGTIITCYGVTACATANAFGGTPFSGANQYLYNWNGIINTRVNCSLWAGMSPVTVTDAKGCSASASVSVIERPQIVLNVSTTEQDCSTPASATVSITGGSGVYTYIWSNGAIGAINSQFITSGIYSVTVSDAFGCTASASFSINTTPFLSLGSTSTNSNCGQNNGSATVTATNGTFPYTYVWSTIPVQTTATATNIPAGAYTVTVTDDLACSGSINVIVSDGVLGSNIIKTNTSCKGFTDGEAIVIPIGNVAPVTYQWSTNPVQTNDTITGLSHGLYFVTLTDGTCVHIDSVTISSPGSIYLSTYSYPSNCSPSGKAFGTGYGGTPPYAFSWNSTPVQTTAQASNLAGGNYIVIVTDAKGCTNSGNVLVSSYCKNSITGYLFYDTNGNCIKEPGEKGVNGKFINAGYNFAYTDTSGFYTLRVDAGTYNVKEYNTYSAYYQKTCPVSGDYNVFFSSVGDTISEKNFAYQPIPNIQDLKIYHAAATARPGFTQTNHIRAVNVGTTIMSGTIHLEHDSILSFINASPVEDNYTYPILKWNFSNLKPEEEIHISYQLKVPVIDSGGYLGRKLRFNSSINPVTGDTVPSDNYDNDSCLIRGAYDPNMKEVIPQGEGSTGIIETSDSLLTYTIHFQNTGTDTAFNITVKDTLSQFLDMKTVESTISSHPYTFSLTDSRIMSWRFENILLVDSFANEPSSHGFVRYTVKQNKNNAPGTSIKNTAAIYFDFNSPIYTNTTENRIAIPPVLPQGIKDLNKGNFILYPNPAKNSFTLKYQIAEPTFLKIYDMQGRIVKINLLNSSSNEISISVSELKNGIYFYGLESNGIGSAKKCLVVIR